jgi:hypothetical protein
MDFVHGFESIVLEYFLPHFIPKKRSERDLFIYACEYMLGGLAALAMDNRRFKSPVRGKKPSLRAS